MHNSTSYVIKQLDHAFSRCTIELRSAWEVWSAHKKLEVALGCRLGIVSCKSNLQLAYHCCVRQKNCRKILKHVLKLCDNRSRNLYNIRILGRRRSFVASKWRTKLLLTNSHEVVSRKVQNGLKRKTSR